MGWWWSWWVSQLDMGAEVVLGQVWQGPRQDDPSLGVCSLGCCLQLCAHVLLWACGDGPLMGWWLLGVAGAGYYLSFAPAVVSLCCFVGEILSHNLTDTSCKKVRNNCYVDTFLLLLRLDIPSVRMETWALLSWYELLRCLLINEHSKRKYVEQQ